MAYNIKGDLSVARNFDAFGGKQGKQYIIEGFVDFTASEPTHTLNAVYINTATGNGSTTTGTTFTANNLYKSNGTTWFEVAPAPGFMAFDNANDLLSVYTGTAWSSAPFSSIYREDGGITSPRTVTLTPGASITFKESGQAGTAIDNISVSSRFFESNITSVTHTSGTNVAVDMSLSHAYRINVSNASTGDVTVDAPTNAPSISNILMIHLNNIDAASRNFIMNATYKGTDGNSLGTIAVINGTMRSFAFYYNDIASEWVAFYDNVPPVVSAIASRTEETITQSAHGFTAGQVVYHDGTDWKLALAEGTGVKAAQAVISSVADVNTFTIVTSGAATISGHGLTVGEYYWLDQTTSGAITVTQPTSGATQQILHVRDANTVFVDIEQMSSTFPSTLSNLSAIQLGLTGTQTPILNTDNQLIVWNSTLYSSGLSMNADGTVTLLAGKKYRLFGSLQNPGVVSGSGSFAFFDKTNSTDIGSQMDLSSMNNNSNLGEITSQVLIVEPTANIDVGIRYVAGTMGDVSVRSVFSIEEIPSTSLVVVDPASLSTNDQSSAGYFDLGNMRIQWGTWSSTVSGAETQTFGQPFASAPYHVNLQFDNAGANNGDNNFSVDMSSATSTSIAINRTSTSYSGTVSVRYLAIGAKP